MVRQHAEDGVDFMTIHAGINRATAQKVKDNQKTNEYCFKRRSAFICLDGNDRKKIRFMSIMMKFWIYSVNMM